MFPFHAGPSRRPSPRKDQRSSRRTRELRKEIGPYLTRIPTEARDPLGPTDDKPAHVPVMLRETLLALEPEHGGLYVDATVGLGGHAEAILAAAPHARLLGLDRDAESLALASRRLSGFGDRIELIHADFRNLPHILSERGDPPVLGILLDLGISSYQLSVPERGFSFTQDGPLDMRMDRSGGRTAGSILGEEDEEELARIFFEYGQERHSRRIARAIARVRGETPIRTTRDLAALVARVVPRGRQRIHPATRVFQALRIAVNGELMGLDRFVEGSAQALAAGGRLVALTFHSLEDQIMKKQMRWLAFRCSCSKSLPHCACGQPNLLRLLTRKPVRPSAEEVAANPRSRSAKLRAAERT